MRKERRGSIFTGKFVIGPMCLSGEGRGVFRRVEWLR